MFSNHLRTWKDLPSIPRLVPSLAAYENEHRILFEEAFFEMQSHPATAIRLEQLIQQLPIRDLHYTRLNPLPTLVFTSPLDWVWDNRKKLRSLESMNRLLSTKPLTN